MRSQRESGGGRSFGSFGVGHMNAPEPEVRQRSQEDRAEGAETIAENLDSVVELVHEKVGVMETAATSGDLPAWTAAKKDADGGLKQLEHIANSARAAVSDANDAVVRERLAGAQQVLEDARMLVASAPVAPESRAPELSCADVLLAALPPDPPPPTWRDVDFKAAEHAVEAVFSGQMTCSDIAAFRAIIAEHADHEIARRFERFGSARRQKLLAFLASNKVKRQSRALQAAQRSKPGDNSARLTSRPTGSGSVDPAPRSNEAAEAHTTTKPAEPTADSSPGSNDVAAAGAMKGAERTAARSEYASRDAAAAATETPTRSSLARKPAAEPREPLGPAIAARVPGITYEGTGRFRVVTSTRRFDVTIQRVQTGVSRLRHGAGTAVMLELPMGLDDIELVEAVAEQLRTLHEQPRSPAVAEANESSPDLHPEGGGPLPYQAEMERSFGRPLEHVKAHTGMAAALAPYGAQAVTGGPVLMFGDARPSPAIVAHEITHKIQNEQAGVAAPMAAGKVGSRHSPAEAEADAMGARVAAAGPGVKLPPVVAAPAASVQFAPQGELQHRTTVAPTAQDVAATRSHANSDDRPVEPLSAERYWVKYGAQTMQAALHRAMAEIVFEIAAPGLLFPTSECGPFILSSFGWRMQDTAPPHVSQLLDAPLYELIDGVRALDDHDRGTDAFQPAVVSRIVERLGLGIHRAVARLALPYAKARSRQASAAKIAGADPIGQGMGPIQVEERDPATQPDPNTLGARTTIEHAVAESLCAGFVEFHPGKFPVVYDTAIPGEPRPVKLALERGRGDWLTVRVIEPSGAIAADVANALYGTPELAHLVVGSGSRYSYVFPPGKQLAEPYETEFRNHMAEDGVSPLYELATRNTQDPVLGLDDGVADQRALASAKASGAVAKGAGAAPALQRLEILASVVDSIASAALPLGVAPMIATVQERLRQRRTACAADPAEATKWAAHTSEQLTLVSDAKARFDAITEQMIAMGLPAASTASGPELVGDVTASMQGPTRELAVAFATAVATSEQLDIGRERLAIAKERLAAYPVDMADRMLAVIRKRIASTSR